MAIRRAKIYHATALHQMPLYHAALEKTAHQNVGKVLRISFPKCTALIVLAVYFLWHDINKIRMPKCSRAYREKLSDW